MASCKVDFMTAVRKRNNLTGNAHIPSKDWGKVLMANGLSKSKATTSAMNHAFSGKTCRKVPSKEQYTAMRNALKPGGELRLHCTIVFPTMPSHYRRKETGKLYF